MPEYRAVLLSDADMPADRPEDAPEDALSDVSAQVDLLNKVFFGALTATNCEEDLRKQLEDLRRHVARLYKQLIDIQSRRSTLITPEMLSRLLNAMPCFSIFSVQGGDLSALISGVSVRYHTPVGRNAGAAGVFNENVLYTTFPVHGLEARLSPTTVRIKSTTSGTPCAMFREIEPWVCAETDTWSHPHVSDSSTRGTSWFENICYGTNRFVHDFTSRDITVPSVLEVLRGFYIWATHANLGDMYDSPLWGSVTPNDAFNREVCVPALNVLFEKAQAWVAEGASPVCPELLSSELFAEAQIDGISSVKASVLRYNAVYAAWMYAHREALRSEAENNRYLRKTSLWGSVDTDAVLGMRCGSYERFLDGVPTMTECLLAPAVLREVLGRGAAKFPSLTLTRSASSAHITQALNND